MESFFAVQLFSKLSYNKLLGTQIKRARLFCLFVLIITKLSSLFLYVYPLYIREFYTLKIILRLLQFVCFKFLQLILILLIYVQVSTETGHVFYCDVRTDTPVFTLKAHDDAIPGEQSSPFPTPTPPPSLSQSFDDVVNDV